MLAVAEMQSLTGERVSGASLDSIEAIERKLELTTKPVCFVRHVTAMLDSGSGETVQAPSRA